MAKLPKYSRSKYDPLLDVVLEKCLPTVNQGIPFLIKIDTSNMELHTIRKGLIKAKSNRTIAGLLSRRLRLIFHDEKAVAKDDKFIGFAISLEEFYRAPTKGEI